MLICFSNDLTNSPFNKANIFLGLIEYELNSLLGAPYLVDYISVHIQFNLERSLVNIRFIMMWKSSPLSWSNCCL